MAVIYDYLIREAVPADVPVLVEIIRNAFREVALRFNLNEQNCPKHPSNCTAEWIIPAMQKGVRYFVLESGGNPCGCAALENPRPDVCYLERLAVLPRYRSRGFGKALVEHVLAGAASLGANEIQIGLISDHTELKSWYKRLGFVETGKARFEHLPFEVTFMRMVLGTTDVEPITFVHD